MSSRPSSGRRSHHVEAAPSYIALMCCTRRRDVRRRADVQTRFHLQRFGADRVDAIGLCRLARAERLKDMDGDGKPEILHTGQNTLQYSKPDPANPTGTWVTTTISERGPWAGTSPQFPNLNHGVGGPGRGTKMSTVSRRGFLGYGATAVAAARGRRDGEAADERGVSEGLSEGLRRSKS